MCEKQRCGGGAVELSSEERGRPSKGRRNKQLKTAKQKNKTKKKLTQPGKKSLETEKNLRN